MFTKFMTTVLIIDSSYGSYTFVGDVKGIQEGIKRAYDTMPDFRQTIDKAERYEKFQQRVASVKTFFRNILGLEDKL